MAIEIEMKYRADPQILALLDREVEGKRQVVHMQTTYYDTKDKACSSRHYTLRKRMENGRSVCTLKTPAQGLGRAEYEVDCDRIEDAIQELCKLSGIEELQRMTAGGLEAVCAASFQRIAKTVQLPDCVVELALDQGVLTGGCRQIPLCEVEVEYKSGSREAAVTYARHLADRFSLCVEPLSKFRRALDLAKGE